ncbi:Tricarboxylate/iron carrier [Hyaloraphidium curvatum]|nr:Tricarboxylate/iron carrier [Hyaloraphidium curvatum]
MESGSESPLYPRVIDLSQPRYPQSTYYGRLRHFSDLTNPRNLLVTGSQLQASRELIEQYEAKTKSAGQSGILATVSSPAEEERLWKAKMAVDSTLHPDTGTPIFLPFRMACFVPTNMLVVAGMLRGMSSVRSIVMWQWINQSVNVGFNYFNANKTTPLDWSETAVAYSAAVATSVTAALSLSRLVPRLPFSPSVKLMLSRLVPFAAVSLAGTANVVLMRGKELQVGIDVRDAASGEALGKSREAAKRAITQTAISRVLIPFPCLTLPPMIMPLFPATWPAGALMAAELGLIAASLAVAMPPAIALFPQDASLKVAELEDGCTAKVVAKERGLGPDQTVVFNRGL